MAQVHESEISLKELILKVSDYVRSLLKSWKFITLMGFLCAFIFLALNYNTKALYKADLTFMLNENEGGSMGGLTAMLGQFGLSGGSSESNLDKILQLSKARTISQEALFEQTVIEGETDFIANHFIQSLDYLGNWRSGKLSNLLGGDKELSLDDFKFTHDSIADFTLKENKALKKIHAQLVGVNGGPGLFRSDYSELTGIMTFSMTSSQAALSIDMVNLMYEKLSNYYIEKAVEKQNYDYRVIKSKYDSIAYSLNEVQNQLAYFQDKNKSLFRRQDQLVEDKLRIEEQKLFTLYAEAEKQKQIAELSLNSKTPYIQAIDKPIEPLRPVNKGRIYYFLLGGFIGGLLSCAYIIVKKMFGEIMAS